MVWDNHFPNNITCCKASIRDTILTMKFNLRQKILLHFFIFMVVNGAIWLFNYYSHSTINQKLIIIEKKKDLLDTVLEARRYEKNFFLRKNKTDLAQAISYIEKTEQKQQIIENSFSRSFGGYRFSSEENKDYPGL
jgi:hypothetical protein